MIVIADNQKGGVNLTEQGRPIWKYQSLFTQKGKEFQVTFIVCQRNTKQLIQLCLESLLRFYPDVNIIVVDDNSNDDSQLYLKYKELTTPNLSVIWNKETLGHGSSLHLAMQAIETEFAFLLDSDVIIERGDFLDDMLSEFETNSKLYCIGARQMTSYSNNGGQPFSEEDAIPYGNPQACLYHVATYHELVECGTDSRGTHVQAPYLTDGTPCILNNKAAHDVGLEIKYFPIEHYISHCGAASWGVPKTIWINDHDIKVRPFLTIVMDYSQARLITQTDNDYDVVYFSPNNVQGEFTFTDGSSKFEVDSLTFGIRFNVQGEYVLDCGELEMPLVILELPDDFITQLKTKVIEEKIPNEIEVQGFKVFKRQYWQSIVR